MFKLVTILFLVSCVAIGTETLQHSTRKVEKLRFGYLAAGSLLSLFYVMY